MISLNGCYGMCHDSQPMLMGDASMPTQPHRQDSSQAVQHIEAFCLISLSRAQMWRSYARELAVFQYVRNRVVTSTKARITISPAVTHSSVCFFGEPQSFAPWSHPTDTLTLRPETEAHVPAQRLMYSSSSQQRTIRELIPVSWHDSS